MVRRLLALTLAVISLSLAVPAGGAVVVRATFNASNDPVFKPRTTQVARGTRVVWRSVDGLHTVTAYGGNWSKNVTLSEGETTARTFKNNGTYKFRCTFHSDLVSGQCNGMCGRIVVG